MLRLVASGPGPDAAIRLEDVALRRGGRRVLDGLSVAVPREGITAIMGPNGAGKSLCLRVMAGLVAPDGGAVMRGAGLAGPQDIALVFQKPVLLRRSVRANLLHALALYGVPRRKRREQLGELLDFGRLAAIAEAPARALSGGEQQRVAMVRALAARPRLLLLDEPTASLDPQATAAIETLIHNTAASGTAVVIVTHDLGQAGRLADHIRFLHRGALAEAAPAAQFLLAQKSPEAQAYLAGKLLL